MGTLPRSVYLEGTLANVEIAREEWNEEMQSAWLYGVLVETERDPNRRRLFTDLGEAATKQASIWAERLREAGIEPPAGYTPTLRARLVARLIRSLGAAAIRPVLAAMKVRGLSVYSVKHRPDRPDPGHVMPTSVEDIGHRHRTVGGGNLRAAVFGVNDGLVSNTSLLLGVAGAGAANEYVVLSGLAGLLAGAFSMAAGEYVSVRSQRELFEYQIGLEKAELEEYPEEETEEVALIYHARGLPLERAREMAREVMKDPDHALDTLAREELGLNPDDLGSPWGASLASFCAFGLGAVVPLVPFLVSSGSPVVATVIVAAAALFGVGSALSLFTGRNAALSGLRMVGIGAAAGAITWTVGSLIGVAV